MKSIYKYQIIGPDLLAKSSQIYKILDVQMQDNIPTVWAIIDTTIEPKNWYFYTLGTGWALKDIVGDYIGTVQELNGYVWHVFAARVTDEFAGTYDDIGEAVYVN